jgi:hypothetical protein
MSAPIEVKVSAATIASAVTGLGLWALQTYVFHGEVPLPVLGVVQTVVPAVITFAAGYLAPHTPRPDLQVDPVDVAAACGAPADPEDETPSGRHVLDDDPDDLPVSHFENPRPARPTHLQD